MLNFRQRLLCLPHSPIKLEWIGKEAIRRVVVIVRAWAGRGLGDLVCAWGGRGLVLAGNEATLEGVE
jgi:hypothetical protein